MSKNKWNTPHENPLTISAIFKVNGMMKKFLKTKGRGIGKYLRAFIESDPEYIEFIEKDSK